ncbi:MAG TPA: QueT transporter family protein [Synergistaceae bacterium]|nr:QueT transporter family protein [Synergistaceae bacterium]HQF90817.1 QueT transporter family protein [Synergistaceae bacterium]HQH77978.1 QueT transporter family protein [Synergistaceae bacterium]HQK24894.1 QueT transporter family protein [Synergistaceae bacterium]
MYEVFSMWGKTKMVVLVALCAGLYAALLIPFKGFVLIPGVTEFRPASALPVVMGLLFGPAGAWGSAIGNLIGDFFGSLGIGSLFGFVGNFFFAYVPYKLWINLGLVPSQDREPHPTSRRKVVAYVVVSFLGSAGCALPIAWGLELLGMVPFGALGSIIVLNNTIPAVVLGLPILTVLYPRIKKWDLLWTDIMDEHEIPVGGAMSLIGGFFMTLSILLGMAGGFLAASRAGQGLLYSGFGAGGIVGSLGVVLVAGIGTAGLVLSSFIQSMPPKKR